MYANAFNCSIRSKTIEITVENPNMEIINTNGDIPISAKYQVKGYSYSTIKTYYLSLDEDLINFTSIDDTSSKDNTSFKLQFSDSTLPTIYYVKSLFDKTDYVKPTIALPTVSTGYRLGNAVCDSTAIITLEKEILYNNLNKDQRIYKNITWEHLPIEYEIAYDADFYDSLSKTDKENLITKYTIESDINLPYPSGNEPTGYHFTRWEEVKDNANFTVTDNVHVAPGHYGNVTLKPVYTNNTYKVVYDNNGGWGSISNSDHVYDNPTALKKSTFTKPHYNFIGWATTPNGKVEYTDEYSGNLTTENNVTITLYAVWEAEDYTISYHPRVPNGSVIDKVPDDETYTVERETPIVLPVLKDTTNHYTFKCWADDAYNEEDETFSPSRATDIDLYALWEPTKCNIIIDANGGTTGNARTLTHTYGEEDVNLAEYSQEGMFIRFGYTHKGFSFTKDGTDMVTSVADICTDTKVYAVWEPEERMAHFRIIPRGYSYQYTHPDGSVTEYAYVRQVISIPQKYGEDLVTPEEYGYKIVYNETYQKKFGCYSQTAPVRKTDNTYSTNHPDNSGKVISDDYDLYYDLDSAPDYIQLTFDYGEHGTGKTDSVNVINRTCIETLPLPITDTGYRFLGWYDKDDKLYYMNQRLTVLDNKTTINLYAKYEKENDYGEIDDDNLVLSVGEDDIPIKDDYKAYSAVINESNVNNYIIGTDWYKNCRKYEIFRQQYELEADSKEAFNVYYNMLFYYYNINAEFKTLQIRFNNKEVGYKGSEADLRQAISAYLKDHSERPYKQTLLGGYTKTSDYVYITIVPYYSDLILSRELCQSVNCVADNFVQYKELINSVNIKNTDTELIKVSKVAKAVMDHVSYTN